MYGTADFIESPFNTLDAYNERIKLEHDIDNLISAYESKFPDVYVHDLSVIVTTEKTRCGPIRAREIKSIIAIK